MLSRIRCSVAALGLFAGALALTGAPGHAQAEVSEITVATQYGISYLPLVVMQHDQLIQKAAAKEGIKNLTVNWLHFNNGAAMNSALLSGTLTFPSGGVGPLITIWSRTRGNYNVHGVACLNTMPLFLTTTNPKVKSIRDFTSKDRIALPAVKVSVQAVTLEMAAAKVWGFKHYDKLDPLTVSMSHPQGMAAMLSRHSEIDAHLSSPPFQYEELEHKGVHLVLNSYKVLGGPATFNCVWTTAKFEHENPKIYKAFLTALREATAFINAHKAAAAKIYIEQEHSKLSFAFVNGIIHKPGLAYTMVPKHVMKYADFMAKVGLIKAKPNSWKELFFPQIDNLPGS